MYKKTLSAPLPPPPPFFLFVVVVFIFPYFISKIGGLQTRYITSIVAAAAAVATTAVATFTTIYSDIF